MFHSVQCVCGENSAGHKSGHGHGHSRNTVMCMCMGIGMGTTVTMCTLHWSLLVLAMPDVDNACECSSLRTPEMNSNYICIAEWGYAQECAAAVPDVGQ